MDNTGSNKEGVEQSYRPKVHGYAPMMTNIGRQGYLLNHQFRRGASHSNCKGSLEYIIASMNFARSLCPKQKLLARFDSGNDSDINIVILSQFKNAHFIVKRHLKGKNVQSSKQTLNQYVINNYSSKKVLPDNTVRYFAEMPYMAGYYNKTNQLVMSIAQIAFNLLRIIGQQALEFPLFNPKFHYGRIRLKTVINKIMALPSLIIRKHRRWTIALPRSNPVAPVFSYLYSIL